MPQPEGHRLNGRPTFPGLLLDGACRAAEALRRPTGGDTPTYALSSERTHRTIAGSEDLRVDMGRVERGPSRAMLRTTTAPVRTLRAKRTF